MAETHDVTCPICNMRVEAEYVRSDWKKRYYRCPNIGDMGEYHTFAKIKTRWKVAKGVGMVLGPILGIMAAGGGRRE